MAALSWTGMIAIMLLKVLVTFTSFAFVSWIYQQHTHVRRG